MHDGRLVGVVRDHNQCFVVPFDKGVDDLLHQLSVTVVETMKRFIEDDQLRVFDEGACQEHEALFAAGEP